MRVFVAGETGAFGERLITELLKQGRSVVGMTTSKTSAKFWHCSFRDLWTEPT